jgi:hypothetical protein
MISQEQHLGGMSTSVIYKSAIGIPNLMTLLQFHPHHPRIIIITMSAINAACLKHSV